MKQHVILGRDNDDAEAWRDRWLSDNPSIKILRVHHPKPEPDTWLTRLGGRNVPRVSIIVEYEELQHEPEKRAAVFLEDHAQTIS
jgi:predicted alpha/beta hydrolase family esterase